SSTTTEAAKCPVDHKARAAWLEQARSEPPPSHPPISSTTQGCDSSQIDQSPSPHPSLAAAPLPLGTTREVSTIPRASTIPSITPSSTTPSPPAPTQCPANSESDTPADAATGNWIYPSERMFFDAMKRKNFDPRAADMRSIVPIHNAVNERAWAEIKAWERDQGGESCGGPKLVSFKGLGSPEGDSDGVLGALFAQNLTPRARWNVLMGARAPFDRHDWVVDRCGTKVEYVIDFYAGKNEGREGKALNFYLDVRPKLNSWEGARMRASRVVGL
ncbi:cytochrome c and c1 heme-lyase, partial [Rhizodiscina lignyota]